jgi:HSP20 family protein
MATNTSQVAAQGAQTGAMPQRSSAAEVVNRMPVDIYEDSEGITLQADMPGVSKERLNVHVDGESLLLEGKVEFDLPEQAKALYADVHSTTYRRSFVLSRELETDKIEANLKDGVLTVHIPKRAEIRPRKIQVQTS